jgi:hypothetical protein
MNENTTSSYEEMNEKAPTPGEESKESSIVNEAAPKKKSKKSSPLDGRKSFRGAAYSEKRISVLSRTATEVKNYKVHKKILTTALVCLVVFTMMLYGVSALYKKTGSFTVSLDKYEMTKYGLTLSESRDMSHNNAHLNAKISEEITNIAGETIDDNVDMIDGAHNGYNYIAYTFYLQNAGEVEISYDYQVNVGNVTQGLDEAIRLRLYVDGVPTTYAKTRSDGGGAEPGTVEFYSSNVMAKGRVDGFMPDDITKFTVVIWIEGNDPDCIDWLIGGQLKVSMLMSVVH